MSDFLVREVTNADIPKILEVEKERWRGLGTAVLSGADLRKWLASRSPFFLLAESRDGVGGYYYGMLADFSFDMIGEYTSAEHLSGTGYTTHMHNKDANSVYGLCIVSTKKGAGQALNKEVYRRVHAMNKDFYFGYSRLSGFNAYLMSLSSTDYEKATIDAHATAIWYAHESMKLIGGKIWDEWCGPCPALTLPPPIQPDPVLSFHARGTGFGLLRVVPEFMPDPESRNFGAFLAYDAR